MRFETRALRPRLTLIVIGLATLAAFLASGPTAPSTATAQSGNGPIVSTALQYLDTHGGQCWTFMAQVVREATGRSVGFGYNTGYYDAGGYQVSADEAQNGDIIQISRPGQNSGSYPGLHTAIVIDNLGGGVFNAIDSNQNWDEWVSLRPNYNPYASANRYDGLVVTIWRIPGGGPGDDSGSTPPQSGGTWSSGDNAVVSTPGCLNLRSSAGISGSKVDCLPNGTAVTITGSAVVSDGYTWVPIWSSAGSGWVAADYLAKTGSGPVPAPVAEPEPDPPATGASGQELPGVATATVKDGPGCLRVRSGVGLNTEIVDCLPSGTLTWLVDGAPHYADGYTWVYARIDGYNDGWIAAEFTLIWIP